MWCIVFGNLLKLPAIISPLNLGLLSLKHMVSPTYMHLPKPHQPSVGKYISPVGISGIMSGALLVVRQHEIYYTLAN